MESNTPSIPCTRWTKSIYLPTAEYGHGTRISTATGAMATEAVAVAATEAVAGGRAMAARMMLVTARARAVVTVTAVAESAVLTTGSLESRLQLRF